MQTPFYKILLQKDEKLDFTNTVKSIAFERALEKDDVLTFKIHASHARDFEQYNMNRGDSVELQFGILQGLQSKFFTLRVTDIQYRYGEQIEITVKALDKGTVMKKTSTTKVWKDMTTRMIVKEIALKYGLEWIVDYDGRLWESLPQGGMSDFEFLQQLALKESEGNYICFISNGVLYFVKRGVDKESNFSFIYGDPASGMLSFAPAEKESTLSPAAIKPTKAQADGEGTEIEEGNNTTLGNFRYDYNANTLGQDVELGKVVAEPGTDETNADNRLKSVRKKNTLEGMKAVLKVLMRSDLEPNSVITVGGVFERHVGNYLVTEVKHVIDQSGGITTCELKKNGQQVAVHDGQAVAENTNNEAGADVVEEETVSVFVYDVNGETVVDQSKEKYAD